MSPILRTFADLVDAWPAAVGCELAHIVAPVAFDCTGVLHVRTSRPLDAIQAAELERVLRRRLPSEIDGVPVARLRFHVRRPDPAKAGR